MRPFVIVSGVLSCIAVALASPGEARAETPKPAVFFIPGMSGAFTTEGKPLPPLATQNLAVSIPVSERWALATKLGYATPFTAFQVAPQVQLGASVRLSDGFRLGANALYRYVPHWSGTPSDANVIGGVLAPTFPIAGTRLLLAFPTGAAYNTHLDAWGISTGMELALPLPF